MDITALHEAGDDATLMRLRVLADAPHESSRAERDIVELVIDMLGTHPVVALASHRLLADEYLPWLERRAVQRARHDGRSWAGIGRILGISRQAARQRFGEPHNLGGLLPPPQPTRLADLDSQVRERNKGVAEARRVRFVDTAEGEGSDVVAW
jgi:hypothetical protein